ncbi:hypothetical protein ACFLXL_01605 [Chloroflexota bacterium]
MAEINTDRYIVSARPTGDIAYHGEEGSEKRFWFLSSELIPEANIYIGAVTIDARPEEAEETTVESHTHDANEIYCVIGDVTTEVILEDNLHIVKAPATIFVPAGISHRVVKNYGKGHLVIVLQSSEYH